MLPDWVIKSVDVSGDGVFCLFPGMLGNRPDQLRLDGLEEGLDHRIVVAVPLAARRDQDAAFAKLGLVIDRAVLGGFNRSSQHPVLGGVDDDRKTEIRALDAA